LWLLSIPVAAEDAAAVTLTEGTPVSGILPGNAHGSFTYYQVAYPGHRADLRIQVAFDVRDAAYSSALGFNVYGPYSYSGQGATKEGGAYRELTYQRGDPATLTVQVYNYFRRTVRYTVVVKGLAVETEADVAQKIAPVVTEPAPPSPLPAGESVSGSLIGNTGGAFAVHELSATGAGEDVTLTMTYSPADPSYRRAFGFQVYAPDGSQVAHGVAPDRNTLGMLKATFSADQAGRYLVQVFNYAEGAVLSYSLATAQ
jgi:hypothetical protein